MDKSEEEGIIDQICDYAERKQIKALLQEYLKRIILEKPNDPISFLEKTIKNDPIFPAGKGEYSQSNQSNEA
jgi:hypothetical protein